jgi:Tfp pilus assembly protein PilF
LSAIGQRAPIPVNVPDQSPREKALRLWEEGFSLQRGGDIDGALAKYRASIEVTPTAEAHTFIGWVLSFRGDVDGAIRECQCAIAVDPDYGNPYNDIGVYLMSKGDLDDAIGWFELAKRAVRYEPRHYPFVNLGRLYAKKGKVVRAIDELEKALELNPGDTATRAALAKLRTYS